MFAGLMESIYVRGIVRINNPFFPYFLLMLKNISGHFSKIHEIIITKRLPDIGKMLVVLLRHSSKLSRSS